MPVSPQDYALWSRMTGNPIPTSPAERMAVAPQVYDFSRNLGRRTEKSGLRKAFDVAGKAALGLGALAGAAYLGTKLAQDEDAPAVEEKAPVAEVEIEAAAPVTEAAVDPVQFAREQARGVSRMGLLAQQAEQQAAKSTAVMDLSGAEPLGVGEASPYALREVLGRSAAVAIPETRTVIPTAETVPSFARRLQLDDEVAVDNDIVAANPISNTALASQDITSADPASAIGQRISTNQTGAAAEARGAAIPQATVASKLATQQSPVHTEESGYGLVGGAEAGAAEAFRKGRQYQAMKQQYSALRDIASPTQEGVSSSSVLPSVTPSAPVTSVTQEAVQPQVLVTPGARRTAEQDEQELLMRKYAAVKPRATVAPSGTEFLRTKVAEGLPQATQRGTVEHAVAEALEQREGMKTLPPGATAYDLPGSSVSRVVMYPNQQVGITYAGDPSSEYGAKSTPEFYGELDAILKSGEFGRGGKHSAGGFIQAGKNLGLLY